MQEGERLATGIEGIDRELSGGLEPGSLLAVRAGPATQSEALLHTLMERRPTLYLSTLRTAEAVRGRLDGRFAELLVEDVLGPQTMDNERSTDLLGTRTRSVSQTETTAGALDGVYEALDRVDRRMNVLIEPINPLERTDFRTGYRELLTKLKSTAVETGGLAVLHCVRPDQPPELRDVTLTISDVVVDLELTRDRGDLEYQLTIPKNRGGTTLLEKTTVKFDSRVWIDDTRAI